MPCSIDGAVRNIDKAFGGVDGAARELFSSNQSIITDTMPKYYSDTNRGYMPTPLILNRVISYTCAKNWYGSMLFDFGSMNFTNIRSVTLNFDRYATNTAMNITVSNVTRPQGDIWSDQVSELHPLRNFKITTIENCGTYTQNIEHWQNINGIITPVVDKTIVCDTSNITGNGYLIIGSEIGTKIIEGTIKLKSLILEN